MLVRNDGTLPLSPELRRLAVIGRLAELPVTGDRGSSDVRSPYVVTPLQGLQAALRARDGRVLRPASSRIDAAVAVAREAEAAVVVVGLSHRDEGEYLVANPEAGAHARRVPLFGGPGDRVDLGLRPRDVELVRAVSGANPRTVVVVVGSAVAPWGWLEEPAAVLYTFYAGMESGAALARLLWGEANPCGKLPFTIPADPADLPPFDPFAARIEYGSYHGYTALDRQRRPALLPFGHGLSYTRFAYRELEVTPARLDPGGTLEVTATVENTGDRAGAEVAQLYVGFSRSAVERPVKLLRGFEKVRLEPGRSQRVRFAVPASQLAYYDDAAHTWRAERVRHEVFVGGSSQALSLEGSFEIV